ncbi:MAG: hypothetical protein ACJA02_000202 [Myxococcota bacterium]|jgi:hypothetical protein
MTTVILIIVTSLIVIISVAALNFASYKDKTDKLDNSKPKD